MAGFLDKNAPSEEAEYSRYFDGDILGKIITKNFLMNCVGYTADEIFVPVGRYGDANTKYSNINQICLDPGDGHIKTQSGNLTFEIKCARINIANRHAGKSAENWAFSNIRRTPKKSEKKYDLLIAVGMNLLGLEDQNYWAHLQESKNKIQQGGGNFSLETMPHQPEFLNLCSFFIVPFKDVEKNYFRVTLHKISKSLYHQNLAPGSDPDRCAEVWRNALKKLANDDSC
ncbi:hypothetical protein D3C75_395390 [compost metagenome]